MFVEMIVGMKEFGYFVIFVILYNVQNSENWVFLFYGIEKEIEGQGVLGVVQIFIF